MSKKKVHELAKEYGVDTKTLIENLEKIGITVKSHLSNLSDEDMITIEKSNLAETLKNIQSEIIANDVIKKAAKAEKTNNPIIIRRQIQVIEDKKENVNEKIETKRNNDVGFVNKDRKKDFNLISRNKQRTQVGSIADLFKKNEPKKDENVSDTKAENKVTQEKKNNITPSEILEKRNKEISMQQVKQQVNEQKQDNKVEKNERPQNGYNKDYKKNNQNNNSGNNNGQRNNRSNNNFNKTNKMEKNITNVVAAGNAVEKEPQRDKNYAQKNAKFKQNVNNGDEQRKVAKHKSFGDDESINFGKIKDLKNQNSLSGMFNDSDEGMLDYYDLSHSRKNNKKMKKAKEEPKREFEKNVIYELKEIKIPEYVTVKTLAEEMKKTTGEVIKKLLGLGIMATINQEIDFDTAFLVAEEFGINAEKLVEVKDEDILFDDTDDNEADLVTRPPVVVVMGHVDHGKTSLLDAIRSTNVIENEAGGITQHIGAYRVKVNDRDITFLDTPGHEAFTSMRARGAQITDIAILVVAADDGIMPQTVEAINHAKAADVPIIVAINKIDVPGANVEKVKESLTQYELVPEEWGGDTICVPISAKKKINIDGLLEMVLLVADMKNLRANPNKQAKGTVIESRLDKNKGVITSLLVQRGTLNVGDTIVLGNEIGKIRAMVDDKGRKIKAAGPSTPVEITGLPEVSEGGDIFYEVENEKVAKHLIEQRKIKQREQELKANNRVTLDDLFSQIEAGNMKELNILVKADVQGSAEAIKQSLLKLSNDEVKIKVIHSNVGAITTSDIILAKVANAIILGFNVRPDPTAKNMAETDKVDIRLYSVIYEALNDIEKAMKGLLDPKFEEEVLGTAEVRQLFKISSVGTIAGSYVIDGKIVRNGLVRLIRDGKVIYTGKIASLKREKDDAKEVAKGFECGIQVEGFNDLKELDQLECYVMKEIKVD